MKTIANPWITHESMAWRLDQKGNKIAIAEMINDRKYQASIYIDGAYKVLSCREFGLPESLKSAIALCDAALIGMGVRFSSKDN